MAVDLTNAGYALLAMWSMLWTVEGFSHVCQPCTFNPLCSCTTSDGSLGEVHCVDVYLPRVPHAFNRSRISTLHLSKNDLNSIDPYLFVNTGKFTGHPPRTIIIIRPLKSLVASLIFILTVLRRR